MKKITLGILAHVDAGKTTLSEGLLYTAGEIRKLGRVDSKNTFLDTDEIEKSRGITVFSKQAIINIDDTEITLLDTPGHIDFSAETERTLKVLDYALLIISASDGVNSHTKTLWNLLKKHNIPTFIFINKLDLNGIEKENVLLEIKKELDENCIDFNDEDADRLNENLAIISEDIMSGYLNDGNISIDAVKDAIKKCSLYPCFSGSALKLEGVKRLLSAVCLLTSMPKYSEEFGARIFKITRDEMGGRLTFLKVTGGQLKVKSNISTNGDLEKINEIRIYSGEKYKTCDSVTAGTICAIKGPLNTFHGQGLGFEKSENTLTSQPIFTYRVILPQNTDITYALIKFKELQEEETQLNVTYNSHHKEIQIRIMGEIQLEVLKQLVLKKYNLDVEFEKGQIVYKETISNKAEGVGHYEPLRHYAEVHLILEPLPRGSGMQFSTDCSEDLLDKNWQRLILTHLMEKQHTGVLTGSPITDIKITLKSGKAHQKHTEGGDFRQATYRAVRQGLKMAQSILLEPYYDFTLEIPIENTGRAMTDLDKLGAKFSIPHSKGDMSEITGSVPASKIEGYHKDLINYTHGKGKLNCTFNGYGQCTDSERVIEEIGYNFDADTENTADSVFCSHGAGFNVKWDEVPDHMHLESVLKPKGKEREDFAYTKQKSTIASDEELLKIFENTYGKVERKNPNTILKTPKLSPLDKPYKEPKIQYEKEYLLIDGYNIIFAWDELKNIAKDSLEQARGVLIDKLSAYKTFKKCEVIVVFDAYRVKGNPGEIQKLDFVTVVYTKEAQTADSYIEKSAFELTKKHKVTVATSDNLEQLIIFGSGAFRLSAKALISDILDTEKKITQLIKENNLSMENSDFLKIIKDRL